MATLITINGTDNITDSRAVINTNFTNLNTDKAETSALTSGLALKVDKVTGKSLIDDTDITKLSGIEAGAEVNITENVTAGTNITIDRVGKDITINSTATGGATTLDELTDVTITTPANGQALTYNGTTWVNTTPAGGGDMLKSENLSGLTDYAIARSNLGLGTLATQSGTFTDKLDKNVAIIGATKTKITYDADGLVTAGEDATGLDIVNTPAGNISATTVQGAINELDTDKVNYADLTSSFVLYPTNVASDIPTYYKMVSSVDDVDYNDVAVDIATPAITGTGVLLASLASSANLLIGNPGVINVPTIGNIKRVSGSASASFYFEIYHRTSGGTETLVATSNNTLEVTSATYIQFSTTALLNNGTWLSTDRIVIKYYATKSGTGSDPIYNFQFGGSLPVRTNFPVPINVLPTDLTAQNVGDLINTATEKTTPVDNDMVGLMDSRAGNILKKLSWANIKATLKTYFDTLYVAGTNNQGYLNIPQNSQSANYTTVLADSGKHIYHPSADTTARTWTIDSNANVPYPIGTAITFVNDTSAGVLTIAITSDTLVLAGAGTTGSRTLRANGIATAIKMTTTRWIINGSGLT